MPITNRHIIFEGAELSGKSWVMSQLYKTIEPEGAVSPNVLDGCYWFNCDLGFFGTAPAAQILKYYLEIFKTLENKNILVEKFHLSELIYDKLYNTGKFVNFSESDFQQIEETLRALDFKIVMLTFPEDKNLLAHRLQDRFKLYPHFRRIAKSPDFYLRQQAWYKEKIETSTLAHLVLEATHFPDEELVNKIKNWLQV